MNNMLKRTLAFVLATGLCAAMAATAMAAAVPTFIKDLDTNIALHEGDTLSLSVVLDSGDNLDSATYCWWKDAYPLHDKLNITAEMWNKDITYTIKNVTEQDAGTYLFSLRFSYHNDNMDYILEAKDCNVTVETNKSQVERIAAAMGGGDIPEVKAGDKTLALP